MKKSFSEIIRMVVFVLFLSLLALYSGVQGDEVNNIGKTDERIENKNADINRRNIAVEDTDADICSRFAVVENTDSDKCGKITAVEDVDTDIKSMTEIMETDENTGGNSTERILECYARMDRNNFDGIMDRLLDILSNRDKVKAFLLAARLNHDTRERILKIVSEKINLDDVEEVCKILEESLTREEMDQVADMAEKYIGLLAKAY